MGKFGFFSGDPMTKWLVGSGGVDRDMELLEDFTYTDPNKQVWYAPKGSVINGASIPNFLWHIIGSPYTGNYRRASIVHDVAWHDKKIKRRNADRMFFYACRAGGCGIRQALTLYIGVRIGAWYYSNSRLQRAGSLDREVFMLRSNDSRQSPEDRFQTDKLFEIRDQITKSYDDPSIEDIDTIIGEHFSIED